jgi:hypothetical protein
LEMFQKGWREVDFLAVDGLHGLGVFDLPKQTIKQDGLISKDEIFVVRLA